MKTDLKKELKAAFEPPAPVRKKEFLRTIPQPKINSWSLICLQASYIPKTVWGMFSLALIVALIGGCFLEKDMLWIISALTPFIALSVLTENARSGVYLMLELEMAARFSLKSVLLARMAILGLAHLILMAFLIPVCAFHNAASVLQTGLYLLVPYTLTTTLGLWAVRKIRGMETMYVCMGIAVGVSGGSILIRNIVPAVYGAAYTPVWAAVLAVLILLSGKEIKRNIRQTEELAWNLS